MLFDDLPDHDATLATWTLWATHLKTIEVRRQEVEMHSLLAKAQMEWLEATPDTRDTISPAKAFEDRGFILPVTLVTRDGGDYCIRCPHCNELMGIDGADMSEVRGEMYRHLMRGFGTRRTYCGGEIEVTHSARFVRELPAVQ